MMKAPTLFPDADDEIESDNSNAGTFTQEPKPYHNRTLPSGAAAESARSFVRSQAVRVSEYIATQGDRGATDREMQIALGMDGNSQRPRRVWLRDHGFIQAKGEPEDIVLRNCSTVWVSVRPLELVTTRAPQDPASLPANSVPEQCELPDAKAGK
ncbi:MAG: hypothetical protein WKF77_15880 [Planctomycetaceae bacterium]